jgi:hypothetical protein
MINAPKPTTNAAPFKPSCHCFASWPLEEPREERSQRLATEKGAIRLWSWSRRHQPPHQPPRMNPWSDSIWTLPLHHGCVPFHHRPTSRHCVGWQRTWTRFMIRYCEEVNQKKMRTMMVLMMISCSSCDNDSCSRGYGITRPKTVKNLGCRATHQRIMRHRRRCWTRRRIIATRLVVFFPKPRRRERR